MQSPPIVRWNEDREERSARWQSERGSSAPREVHVVDDRITADEAYGLACQGIGLLWRGDFQNARQMLNAMAARADRRKAIASTSPADAFNRERQARAQRARTLGMLLVPLDAGFVIPLRRAPDVAQACSEAYGGSTEADSIVSLRELQGVIGAHEWRRNGVEVAALRAKIHPHYGVFAPIRGEYVDLVARAPLPAALATFPVAFDVGTGTGVLAAVLARRGIARVIATDLDPRALACARDNLSRLGLGSAIEVVEADLFPEGRAALAVCNPPWVPARPSSPLERGIYDPESAMLRGFLGALSAHLHPGGEGWLLLSDLAEHLGLRSRESLLTWIGEAGLRTIERLDVRPRHPRVADPSDPLYKARKAEVTSLWRLAVL